MGARLEILKEIEWPLEDMKHAQLRRTVVKFLEAEIQFEQTGGCIVIPTVVWDKWIDLLREACVTESLHLQQLINAAMALQAFRDSGDTNEQRYKMLKKRLGHYTRQFRRELDNIPDADDGSSDLPVINASGLPVINGVNREQGNEQSE